MAIAEIGPRAAEWVVLVARLVAGEVVYDLGEPIIEVVAVAAAGLALLAF